MRTITDANGQRWQATLLNASYGSVVLLFSPLQGDGIRQHMLDVANQAEGAATLAEMDEETLRQLFAEAEPWDPASGGM